MIIKLVKFFSSLTIFAIALSVYGCAENVSHKVETVKSDLTKLMELVGQPSVGKVNVMAKASSVLASIAYEKNAANEVQRVVAGAALTLGYKPHTTEKSQPGRQIFCHLTDPGRSILVERLDIEPPTVSVSVSISGWKQDAERCSGNKSK